MAVGAVDRSVLSQISKWLQALRKKHNRILQMEESLAQGRPLNKEQEELLRSKLTVSLYQSSNPALVAAALDTMKWYISWIDFTLVANDAFIPLLFDLILAPGSSEQLRSATADCILAIVFKRMDPSALLSFQGLRTLFVAISTTSSAAAADPPAPSPTFDAGAPLFFLLTIVDPQTQRKPLGQHGEEEKKKKKKKEEKEKKSNKEKEK